MNISNTLILKFGPSVSNTFSIISMYLINVATVISAQVHQGGGKGV